MTKYAVDTPKQRVAVIGSGPAGCAAAHRLSQQSYDVEVFESASAVGGRTYTFRKDNFHLDTGAGFITNFYPRVFELAKSLNFSSDILEMHRVSGLNHDGRATTLNVGSALSFAQFPLLSWGDKLKMGLWTAKLTLKRKQYDIARPETLDSVDTQSIADYARKNLSEDIYHFLIRPGIEPFWYFSCEEASEGLVLGLTAQAAGARFYFIDGGIDKVCSRLLGELNVHLNSPVMGINPTEQGIELSIGEEGQTQTFDKVVVATTASVASRLSEPLPDAWLSKNQRDFLSSQKYASNIHATFKIPRLSKDINVSSVFPCGPGRHAPAALSFHRKKHPGSDKDTHELVSLYLSDEKSKEMLQETDEALYLYTWKLAQTLYTGLPDQAEPFHLIRRNEAIPVHAPGRYRLATTFQTEQLASDSPVRFCGDYLATATIDGALATGFKISSDW